MSSSTIMDSFDAPMLDYSGDMDVHMHTTVSSPKPWTQPETIMEEDLHPIHLPNPFPSHLPQQDVEIDMDDYYNENVEYEMADGEIAVPDTELVDIDVYDATREETFSASAPVSHTQGLTNQDLARKPEGDHYPPSDSGVAADHIPATSNLEATVPQSVEPELLTPTPLQTTENVDAKSSDQSGAVVALRLSTPPSEAVSKDRPPDGEASAALREQPDPLGIAVADGTTNNIDAFRDAEQKKGLESSTAEHEPSASMPQTVTQLVEESSHQAELLPVAESHEGVRGHDESNENDVGPAALGSIEAGDPDLPSHESHEAEEDDADPHEISEGVYIEPPPPVLIELPSTPDQPVCALFNAPPDSLSGDSEVHVSRNEGPYTVLLQNRPTLYYETLNDVFDALRAEERIQSLAEFVEGEMIIDAYDLQLVVSEDNVHARETSLHDLNVLHHGLGLMGPLRLRLRTVLSRFMHRYRSLQDRIARLNITRSANYPAEDLDEQAYTDRTRATE
ncbi:hypothetical protein F5148DRAFT_674266 [Russula earlei]|uniref:Uncharacterized protein n=1 Tax=Russula earlei TaxID=71964 RepID=A0ACC0UE23_9AGAM|nr:hypothetical protein F5148DRAFT_674266 [Russula earlei]